MHISGCELTTRLLSEGSHLAMVVLKTEHESCFGTVQIVVTAVIQSMASGERHSQTNPVNRS